MKKFIITVFLICGCFVLGTNSYAADFSIGGKITSLGKGVKGVEININDQIYETDENGCYKAEHISAGEKCIIKVERPDFYSSPSCIKIESLNDNIDNADFVVNGEISGQVIYKEMPLKNAIVKISDRQQEYFTDSKGKYRILNVGLNQEYTVSVSSATFAIVPKKITLKSCEPEQVDSATQPQTTDAQPQTTEQKVVDDNGNTLNFQAEISKYSVSVSVMHGLMPLENAEIVVNNDTKNKYKTDKEGICKIENLVGNRKYIIKAEKKNYIFAKRIQTIDNLINDETINFEAFVDVSGRITIDNEPFENIVVECGDRKVKTDKNGNYVFKNIEPNKPYIIKPVNSTFEFTPKQIDILSLKNSIAENNFATSMNIKLDGTETEESKKLLQKQKAEKISAVKKESSAIMKEENAKQKALSAEIKKKQDEEDLKIKEEILQEQNRIKERQIQEDKILANYKAILEAEKAKENATVVETKTETVVEPKSEPAVAVVEQTKNAEQKQEQQVSTDEGLSIQGCVLNNKNGVGDVQILLICPPETKKYSTDKNGFYKISNLEKNKNYVVTVLVDAKTTKLSPKSRIYKELNTNMKNQNFYYIVDRDAKAPAEK